MGKLLLLVVLLTTLASSAFATDVVFAPNRLDNFQPSNLGNDVTVNVTVTNGSTTVTSAGQFRSAWIGLGGFRVTINGTAYTVAAVADANTLTLTSAYAGGTSSTLVQMVVHKYVEMRWYASASFQPLGQVYVVQAGTPGTSAWHKRYAASISTTLNGVVSTSGTTVTWVSGDTFSGVLNGKVIAINGVNHIVSSVTSSTALTLTATAGTQTGVAFTSNVGASMLFVPQVTIDATVDAPVNNTAKYTIGYYRPDNSLVQYFTCSGFQQFSVPATTPTNYANLCSYNAATTVVADASTYTRAQIDARLPACAIGQMVYYAATGNAQSCLAVGSGLLISGGTITATGGGGGSITVKEVDGTPTVASVTTIRVTNGTLTDDGAGQVTVVTGAGGGGTVSGTVDRIPRFDTTTSVSNSILAQSGTSEINFASGSRFNLGAAISETIEIANDTTTGTTNSRLAKLSGAPSKAIVIGTSDTGGIVGIVVANGGTTGNAKLAIGGFADCEFDAATTAGNYVIASTSLAGRCRDGGASYPTTGVQVLGRVLTTNASAGTYSIAVFGDERRGLQASGTTNYLPIYTSATTLGSSNLFFDAGNSRFQSEKDILIFTTAASSKLLIDADQVVIEGSSTRAASAHMLSLKAVASQTGDYLRFTDSTSALKFRIDSDGDALIRAVAYTWPGANAAGVLNNNGSGTLTWTASPALADPPANSVQYNNGSNLFEGDAAFLFDPTTATATVGQSSTITGKLLLRNAANTNTFALSPGTITTSYTLTPPSAPPGSNQCLEMTSTGAVVLTGSACGAGGGSVTGTGAANQATYWTGTSAIAGEAAYTYTAGTNTLAITDASGGLFQISNTTATSPAFSELQAGQLLLRKVQTGGPPFVEFRRGKDGPGYPVAGDVMALVNVLTTNNTTSNSAGTLQWLATDTHSGSQNGTGFELTTTTTGGTAVSKRMVITGAGAVSLGNSSAATSDTFGGSSTKVVIGSLTTYDAAAAIQLGNPAAGTATKTVAIQANGSQTAAVLETQSSTNATLFSIVPNSNRHEARLFEDPANGSNYTALRAPSALGSNITFTLPGSLPATAGCLEVDSTGVINQTGSACGSGGGGAPTTAQYVVMALDATLSAERNLVGSANQVVVTDGGANAAVTLSAPQNLHTSALFQVAALGVGTTAPSVGGIDLFGKTINTDANNTIAGLNTTFSLTKNDALTRTYFGTLIKPTINAGASNANTTLNVMAVDTTNTATTGVTTNLLKLSYGGTERIRAEDDGDFYSFTTGSTTGAPRVLGFSDSATSEASRLQVDGTGNGLISGNAQRLIIYSFWGLNIFGNRQSATPPAYEAGASGDSTVYIKNAAAGRPVLDLDTISSPTADVLRIRNNGTTIVKYTPGGSTLNSVFGNAALATSATDGFIYYPSAAGVPTGTPTGFTGTVPTLIDTTNSRFYAYISGAWANLSGSGSAPAGTGSELQARLNATTLQAVTGSSISGAQITLTDFPTVSLNNASTSTVDKLLDLIHNSTGTPANGMGGGIRFGLETSTTVNADAATINASWSDVTHATRTALLNFTVASGGATAEVLRLQGATSAINYVRVTNAITGTGPEISAVGDANLDLLLVAPGTGVVKADGIEVVTLTGTQTLTNKTLSTGTAASVAISFADGIRQTFNPNGTNAGLNVGAHTADPSSPSNGDLYYDSTNNLLRARINSAWVSLGAGGGSSPPFVDTTSIVEGSADATKEIRFEVDGLTSGAIRVLTPQDANYTLAGLQTTQTFTSNQTINSATPLTLTQAVSTSGSPQLLTVTGGAHTTLAADTEAVDFDLNLSRTVQFTAAGGTFNTQRVLRLRTPTLAATSAETIGQAFGFEADSPKAGTNMTLTESWVARFLPSVNAHRGLLIENQGAAPTGLYLSMGPTGSADYVKFRGAVTGGANVIDSFFANATLVTSDTAGFVHYPSSAGVPTGVPANLVTNVIPTTIDRTNNRFYGYIGGAWVNLSGGGSSPPFVDTTSIVEGSADGTKEIRFEVDGLTTGTVRVLTPPDANIVISGSAAALTSGRVPFVTTGGLLLDSADFRYATGSTQLELGTASSTTGKLRLAVSGDANFSVLQAGDAPVSDVTYKWPADDPAAADFLKVTSFSGGVAVLEWAAAGGSSPPFADTNSIVEGSADATKEIRFEVDGLTTGTVRVLTPQDANYTLAGVETSQTFTAQQFFNPGTTPQNAVFLSIAAIGSAGTRDSHNLVWRGASNDGSGHTIDWISFVDVTSNAGASTWTLQTRIDAGGFANALTIGDGGLLSFNDGIRQTFNPNGTNAGLNVGAHTADPSSPTNGDLYYDSTNNLLRARINSAWVSLGAGGGGSPGGSSGEIQWNNASSFDGIEGSAITTLGEVLLNSNVRSSGGSTRVFAIRTPADTGLTADTESIGMQFGGNSSAATVTRQFTAAAGTFTTQREIVFVAPTYGFTSADTITNAATVAITGPPAVGANATITNTFALQVQDGASIFQRGGVDAETKPSLIIEGNNTSSFAVATWRLNGSNVFLIRQDAFNTVITPLVTGGSMFFGSGSGQPAGHRFTVQGGSEALTILYDGTSHNVGINKTSSIGGQLHVVTSTASKPGLVVDSAANSTVDLAKLTLTADDTATVANHTTLAANSQGTAAAGFGASLSFTLESSTTNDRAAGNLAYRWHTATDASRTSFASLATVSNAGSVVDKFVVGPRTALTDASTNLFEVALPTLKGAMGHISFVIFASDGTDVQVRRGLVQYGAVNKGGTYTSEIAVVSEAASASSGALTATWAITPGTNKVTISVTPSGSLTETTYYILYTVTNNSEQALTIL